MTVTNKDFIKASRNKKDEFYTQLTDIEKEMRHFKEFFRGKVVFCNCDDPEYSNFWRYFQNNFYEQGLKWLVSTHYDPDKPTYRMDIVSGDNEQQIGIPAYVQTPLQQNGDFRSQECIDILKEADVIVTIIWSHVALMNGPVKASAQPHFMVLTGPFISANWQLSGLSRKNNIF